MTQLSAQLLGPRGDRLIHETAIGQNGTAKLVVDLPDRTKQLRLRIVEMESGTVRFTSPATQLAQLKDHYEIEIGKGGDTTERPPSRGEVSFRIVVKDQRGQPVPGLLLRVAAGGDEVFSGQVDNKGVAQITFPAGPDIVAAELRHSGAVIARNSRPVGELGKWWVIEVERNLDQPGPPEPVPGGGDGQTPGGNDTPSPVDRPGPAMRLRGRIEHARSLRAAVRDEAAGEIRERKRRLRRGRALAEGVLGKRPRRKLAGDLGFVPAGQDPRPRQDAVIEATAAAIGARSKRGVLMRSGTLSAYRLRQGSRLDNTLFRQIFDRQGPRAFQPPNFEQILRDCAARTLAQPPDPKPDPIPDTVAPPPEPLSLQARIAGVLDAALGTTERRPTASDLTASLSIDLPSGPADVDAFHDFHSIQVAWQDTWTAVVDDRMKDRMKELYELIVEVVDPEEVEADLSEIDELHAMLDTLADEVTAASQTLGAHTFTPPEGISGWVPQVAALWRWLTENEQDYVLLQKELETYMAGDPDLFMGVFVKLGKLFPGYPSGWVPETLPLSTFQALPNLFKDRAEAFVDLDDARARKEAGTGTYATNAASRLGRAERLIGELKESLVEPYQFDVFAPGSYNFGTLATYRQRWRPLAYQVGDLAGSIPLAPGEKRSVKVERKVTRKDSTQRSRQRLSESSRETEEKRRAEGEITQEVKRALSAGGEVSGGGEIGVVSVNASANFDASQDSASQATKKEIREITTKVAQKYRDERKVEVKSETSYESTYSETREISNPNDELTVTYLFYELQRRYEVAERLHDLQPIILVAYDMPQPSEITEAWLIKHDWIIRDALLDDSFAAALGYLGQTFAGDEVAVEILEQQWKAQLQIVADLRAQGAAHQDLRDAARLAVQDAVTAVGYAEAGEAYTRGGIGRSLGERIYAAEGEIADAQAENARASLDWAEADLARIEATAREAVTALERATAVYVAAVEARLNRRVQIDRLILHVKENIFHYMQAIWMREHPDARYLRLYDMDIQWPGARAGTVVETGREWVPGPLDNVAWPPFIPKPEEMTGGWVEFATPRFRETRKLHEIANLQRPLAFRGNLAVFPLTEHNALTTWLAQDFLDGEFGLFDPDPLARLPTATEALEIAECAWKNPGLTDAGREKVTEWLMDALAVAHRVSTEIVVPTGELFIEALPGAHPLLEDFKLRHRAMDAAAAGVGVRASQLDLIRRAMRLEAEDTSDPDIDRHIRVDGSGVGITVADGD
ncbi:hypothetical protein [Roseibaca sp. Y0-43]|uniref:hypothetical protein n=1 Tax=Roseibaca sp. Y0-43 TaxID=2816854 RepID=UPI001D0CA46A|nr:hypothetical protein [Roseibaca sp. Y0-43]MCC1480785.1 hypothetical protein [Roseibaca sp. Y0-43]